MHWVLSPEPPFLQLNISCVEYLLLSEAHISAVDQVKWMKTNLAVTREHIEPACFAQTTTNVNKK